MGSEKGVGVAQKRRLFVLDKTDTVIMADAPRLCIFGVEGQQPGVHHVLLVLVEQDGGF